MIGLDFQNNMTEIVHLKKDQYDVYIGRGSIFGNPYEMGIDGDRNTVILRYRKWFNFLLKDPRFEAELKKLKNKRLACFCAPLACHGDVIKEYLDNLQT